MAILTRIVNGSFTELYIGGGSGWLTQSAPTNFHRFWKRKVLTASESVEDFREVSDSEKTALEAQDAKWERPPQPFIDRWNSAWGDFGCYNEQTGFFEGNTLTDITYQQALSIMCAYGGDSRMDYSNLAPQSITKARTLLPVKYWINGISCSNLVAYSAIETIRFWSNRDYDDVTIGGNNAFTEARKLRHIFSTKGIKFAVSTINLVGCSSLESIKIVITSITTAILLRDSSLLNLDSFRYMVDNAANTSTITITVHAKVYAKLTDETNAEWHQVLLDAAQKDINFATP